MWRDKSVVVAVTGGIAAYKVCSLVSRLTKEGAKVRVAMTHAATSFVSPGTFAALSGNPVSLDLSEGSGEITHIKMAQDSDLIVVAPATANIIAKAAHGLADDLVSTILVAATVPVVVVPAMNSGMWANPAVQSNINLLQSRGLHIVPPENGQLACGTSGSGRYPDLDEIMDYLEAALTPQILQGRRVLVTAGPTREYLDPVRFLSNPSTGLMGLELARAAWIRGAQVGMVLGPVDLDLPRYLSVTSVVSAEQMADAVVNSVSESDFLFMTAAVADYRPSVESGVKIKKNNSGMESLALVRNPDILSLVKEIRRADQVILGFAAETGSDLKALGREKLLAKGLDFIVANSVYKNTTGFGAPIQSQVLIQDRNGSEWSFTQISKKELAGRICQLVSQVNNGVVR